MQWKGTGLQKQFSRTSVRQGFTEWLGSLETDHFVTLTFRDTANDYRATRAAETWFRDLHRQARPCACIYVVEPHPGRPEAHHIHALVKYERALWIPRTKDVVALWRWGYADVYICNGNAARYVSKYIARKDCPDWNVLGDLHVLRSEPCADRCLQGSYGSETL